LAAAPIYILLLIYFSFFLCVWNWAE
jgi:hypothetical protein